MSGIMDLLGSQLGQSTIQKAIGQQLGIEDESLTGKAVGAALPMIMGAVGQKSTASGGADLLGGLLDGQDDGLLDDLGGFIGGGGNAEASSNILGQLLGNKQALMEQGLSRGIGIDSEAAGGVLSMLAPIVMGQIGRTQKEQGLDISSLVGMLGEEGSMAQKALDGLGMSSMLDLDGDGSSIDDVVGFLPRIMRMLGLSK